MDQNNCKSTAIKAGLSLSDILTLLEIAKNASEIGSSILRNHYGNLTSINHKETKGYLVTNADIESEAEIIKYLTSCNSEISILAEERGFLNHNNNLYWCIDPLDGTTNFAHGYPFFATSIGLVYEDCPILGSISIPFIKEHYWAAPSVGAFCNGETLHVSSNQNLTDSLLVTGFAYDRHKTLDNNYSEFCRLTHRSRGVRRGGAAAVDLAFVASGRIDGYWERGLAKWDLAAGVAIVELSGGRVTDYYGNNFDLSEGKVLATNGLIHNQLSKELNSTRPIPSKYYEIDETNN